MASTVVIGKLRYDIVSDSTKFEKGLRASRKELKRSEKAMKDSFTPMTKLRHERIRLDSDLRKGIITQRAYVKAMRANLAERLKLTAARRASMAEAAKVNAVLARTPKLLHGIVGGLTRTALGWRRARKEKMAYAATPVGRGPGGGGMHPNMLANFGGSLGSGLGMGGAGAGVGRMLGMSGAGAAGGALAGIGASAIYVKEAVGQFAEFETAVVDLQVLMGDDTAGKAFVETLRGIARETPLTTTALVKNAQTMLGYGLSAEGLENTLTRLGTVAGGDTERFGNLTRAFSQIQSAGKLMGQELLQLINAGFPIAEIAKQAGVEMKDFRKEMEAGAISADSVTEALIALTSAGGMMDGRLERQAETVAGHWTRIKGEISESFAKVGEEFAPIAHDTFEWVKNFALGMNEVVLYWRDFGAEVAKFKEQWDLEGIFGVGSGLSFAGRIKEWGGQAIDAMVGLNHAQVRMQRLQDLRFSRLSEARTKRKKDAQAVIEKENQSRQREVEEQNKNFEAMRKTSEEKISKIVDSRMSEQEKFEKDLRDLKQSYLDEEINWFQYNKLRAQATWIREQEKAAKREEKLIEKRKALIKEALKARTDQINKEAEAAKKRVNELHVQFKEAAAGNAPGVDSTKAGADYAFLAKRQQESRAFLAQQISDKKREAQLDQIKGKQDAALRRAERTAEWMEENLDLGSI